MNVLVDTVSTAVQVHDIELWHSKLSHVNYKLLYKLGNKVLGIRMFEREKKLNGKTN